MTETDYKQALKTAREERAKLMTEKNKIEARVAQLNQTIYTLTRLCGGPVDAFEEQETGITDAVRNVLRSANGPLSSREVKNILLKMGFPISGDNPQASVNVILTRLSKQKEITPFGSVESSPMRWVWKARK